MKDLAIWREIRRLFTVYPRGLHGAGLFLLRLGVGGVLVLSSVRGEFISPIWGALLVAGFLTPLAALVMAAALTASLYGSTSQPLDLSILLLAGGCVAVALLGPGNWSVDARLFGRREIVIPRRRR